MNTHDKISATQLMNDYGRAEEPFIFVIDFEMEKIIVEPLHAIGASLSYSFPSGNSMHDVGVRDYVPDWAKSPIEFDAYSSGFAAVMQEINLGNTFLINLAFPTEIKSSGSLSDIYHSAIAKYKLLIKGQFAMFSPETFVKIEDDFIYTYPMKGTIDADIPNALEKILSDKKELAEHYTIVDLLRNDLSMVAKEVSVTKFRYPDILETNDKNLIQISSEIKGKLREGYQNQLGDIIFKMLPAGSISGAPKKKTVEIIRTVEGRKRGYYTGVAGIFDGRNLDSAVMIRYVEQIGKDLTYMSGCGVTFQSDVDTEYQEMIDKVYLPRKVSVHTSIVS